MHNRRNRTLPKLAVSSASADSDDHRESRTTAEREILRGHARQIRLSRGLRENSFDPNMFGEPAWDILLTLYVIENEQRRVSMGETARLANLPLTTALRWLDYLEEQGLIERNPNPFDQRAIYTELSNKGRSAMDDYLLQVQGTAVRGLVAFGT